MKETQMRIDNDTYKELKKIKLNEDIKSVSNTVEYLIAFYKEHKDK